ncbi:S-adenosyl-L-methionine-dependent methyltransferase, partial [Pyronema domesticum]
TSTASLTSSINQYVFENGRRYHSYYGTDKYLMPTDEQEQDRLDLHHEIMRLAWDNKLHESPLNKPHRILNIGTRTGIWAIEMADQYPMAEVVGTDLSPIQPGWVPTNCRFEVDDAMLNWTFKDNYFDFIHSRNICSGVSNWKHLMSEIMRCTTPGGYVEMCEYSLSIHCDDGTMKDNNGLKIQGDHLRDAMVKMGRPLPDIKSMKQLMEQAGFEDIKAMQVTDPIGPWPKDPIQKRLGAMVLLHCDTVAESYGMAAFTRVLGMDADEARGICNGARQAARNKNFHMYSL